MPRRINVLYGRALLAAGQAKQPRVDGKLVDRVAREVSADRNGLAVRRWPPLPQPARTLQKTPRCPWRPPAESG